MCASVWVIVHCGGACVSMVCVQFLHLPSLVLQNHHRMMVEMRTPCHNRCMVSCLSYVTFASFEDVSVKSLPFSADHPSYLMLFREHVSRKAADKGRAVLEGVGLTAPTIHTCFENHPRSVEEAVHTGLIKWSEGQGLQPPTWTVLLKAMSYSKIAQQHIQDLKTELGLL